MKEEKFMNVVRWHTGFAELIPTLLWEFVEKIVVYECGYDENKTCRKSNVCVFFFSIYVLLKSVLL